MNLVDSSGWLEYFADGKNAGFFAPPIQDIRNLACSTINIHEVFKKILEQKDENGALEAIAAMQQARVVDFNSALAISSAGLSYELKLSMADSIILATARSLKATLWTQDSHFANLPDVKYIPK
ncbi:MAG: twitching motility protein PilT [Deltaproteobacteria bacterium SM23_61]|nr:MAG: twitching motility protein PilT [Deltaproteobacteria bacterium SM23_61]